jgi:hypothetical protein
VSRPACYGVRRLNPLRGVMQVVDTGNARALSGDGLEWEVQVLAEQPEHSWHSPNQHRPVMRFFRFGVWSASAGLGRVPVSPLLDLDAMWAEADALVARLNACADQVPFPLGDPYELWLQDAAGEPFCLSATTTRPELMDRIALQPWAATPLSEHGFVSPGLKRRGIPVRDGHDPRRHAGELERLVRTTAGSPARHAWFLRQGRGLGTPISAPGEPRPLPWLPLRPQWPDAGDTALVWDYFDWCAPTLLTLPDLDHPTRERLEQAVRGRAREVAARYRLYPRILNPGLIRQLRVEARIRSSAEPHPTAGR